MQFGLKFLHLFDGGAEGNPGHEVEGDSDRRQLADVGNAHRPEVAREPGNGAKRNKLRNVVGIGDRTANVELPERIRIALKLRFDFEDDPVFVDVGVNGGGLAFAVGVVERVFDLAGRDAERGGLVAVNFDHHLRIGDKQVTGHVLKNIGYRGYFVHQNRRPMVKLLRVGVLQTELIQRLGQHATDADERRVLQIHVDARNLGEFRAEFLNDLVRV